MPKISRANCADRLPKSARSTMKSDMPMSVYNVTQTGAKTQFGGANDGFFKFLYQVGMDGNVKIEPIKPAN
jgi:hypothetical protein